MRRRRADCKTRMIRGHIGQKSASGRKCLAFLASLGVRTGLARRRYQTAKRGGFPVFLQLQAPMSCHAGSAARRAPIAVTCENLMNLRGRDENSGMHRHDHVPENLGNRGAVGNLVEPAARPAKMTQRTGLFEQINCKRSDRVISNSRPFPPGSRHVLERPPVCTDGPVPAW